MNAVLTGLSAMFGLAAAMTLVCAIILGIEADAYDVQDPRKWAFAAVTPILLGLAVTLGVLV